MSPACPALSQYQPEELILTVQARHQRWPKSKRCWRRRTNAWVSIRCDWTLFGRAPAKQRWAARCPRDASGSGRLRHGAARDSLLGFRAVNGFGEAFRGGGKVVKNVTGFDLPKLVCGAFGTLCVLTELTFRVYPTPRFSATLALKDLSPEQGFAALRKIWQSALEPSGLAYVPAAEADGDIGQGAALIRFEGGREAAWRKNAPPRRFWSAPAKRSTDGERCLPPSARACRSRGRSGPRCLASVPAAVAKRPAWPPRWRRRSGMATGRAGCCGSAAGRRCGAGARRGARGRRPCHAAARAGGAARRAGPFAPQPAALAGISARVKAAFDPLSLFNPGRI